MSKVIKGNKITWVEAILIITDLVPSLGIPQSIENGLGIGVDEVTDTIKEHCCGLSLLNGLN